MANMRQSLGSVNLALPNDPELLKAAGAVGLAHGQLELMLRMTVKSLSGLTIEQALDATEDAKNWELRRQIERLFKQKTTNEVLRLRIKAILKNCERLSAQRNKLLHNAWAISEDGSIVTQGEKHAWGPAATVDDLQQLAHDIYGLVSELNDARLRGFIKELIGAAKT